MTESLEPRKNLKFILVTIPMFMGYATCFNLQRYLKESAFIESFQFSYPYSFLYMGNLLFRLLHNFFWMFTTPYWRILISLFFMICAELFQILAQILPFSEKSNNVWIAYLTYACGGIGIGTFESNVMSVMSLVSPGARYFAVLGIPVGINIITIGSFFFIEILSPILSNSVTCIIIFGTTIAMCLVASFVLLRYVPHQNFIQTAELRAQTPTSSPMYLWNSFRHYRTWLVQLVPSAVAMMVNMFTVSQFAPGIALYTIASSSTVRFLGADVKADYFRSICGIFTFVGNFASRLLFEKVRFIFPPILCCLNVVGAIFVILGSSELIVLGSFIIMFSDGIIYVQSSKLIKKITEETDWNLSAFSFWLFVGDCGSVIASFTQQSMVKFICGWIQEKSTSWNFCPYY
ncbi:Major facilitator superfamily protein [Spironucleus salmonicida]|uniref:Major facilitator superfamily protein n=1 Tax=Spironucleus salmonicida TaxID=348837 RepID=V6LZ63_9EUKA|nr:Major facilitator superfamily protein [Spironucleus salmonicida]|eukprot:EST46124.1 Major facilitator superfamily protein [Spironucleus salmonicida]